MDTIEKKGATYKRVVAGQKRSNMTLFEKLKGMEGKQVTLHHNYGSHVIKESGVLEVQPTTVYPYDAFISVCESKGGFFVGAGTVIGEGTKNIISLRG